MASLGINEAVLRPVRAEYRRWKCALASLVQAALFVLICQGVVAQDSTASRFIEPVRITQLANQPPSAVQPPSNVEAIQPSSAGQADVDDDADAQWRVPFQHRLPRELMPRQADPATKEQFERFIPKIVDPQNTLNLLVGHPRILTFADWAVKPQVRLYLPDEGIARWDIISDTEVAIVGTAPGTTVLTLWFNDPTAPKGKRVLSYRLRVYEDPTFSESLDEIEEQINKLFPDSRVKLSIVRDRLVVQGEAKDAIEAAQILSVLAQTRNENRGGRYQNARTETTEIFVDQDRFVQEEQSALRRHLLDPTALIQSGIVNLLRIPGEQQVMLRVTVAEVNRSAARSIGLDFSVTNNSGVTVLAQTTAGLLGGSMMNMGNISAMLDNGQIPLAINALRTLNLSRTLAEPNLTTLNGRMAEFQAGGQFPVPVLSSGNGGGNNLQGVQFVPFGVQLQFTPYVIDRDRIRLQISAEVSTRDESSGTNIGGNANSGGTSVPGLNTRNFSNTVELREGQTLAVAGLIQNNFGSQTRRIPLWGDLPLIGATGSSNGTSSGEQELVILVTPELVTPLQACNTPPPPGADVFEPTDVEFYLGNRLESRRSRDFRSSVRTDYGRLVAGQKCDCNPFIIGPSGHSYGCCDHPHTFHDIQFSEPGEALPLPKPLDAAPLPPQVETTGMAWPQLNRPVVQDGVGRQALSRDSTLGRGEVRQAGYSERLPRVRPR